MSKLFIVWLLAAALCNAGSMAVSQKEQYCKLVGTYRVNVAESDKLYSVVKEATSTVPFGDQQQFFMDLSTRLTPPDLLGIDCKGQQVSIGSSRGARVTYIADGRTKRERGASGNFVDARVEMKSDTLTFISNGAADDSVNVSFQSLAGGTRLAVTRRIYASQLPEPIIIRTIYDRISAGVDWNDFDDQTVAKRKVDDTQLLSREKGKRPTVATSEERFAELRSALGSWIDATNRRDIAQQMRFYAPVLTAYYLTRNTSQSAVLAEKRRVFGRARTVDIRASEPEIIFQNNREIAKLSIRRVQRAVSWFKNCAGDERTANGE
ncbi:MAG: hypothetical protein PSX80_00135 [bacterium]|nr:hypothetical protein [bacterium]